MPPDQRPPSPDRLTGWSPEVGPGLDAALEELSVRPMEVVGRLPWSSNLTFLVALDGSDPGSGGSDRHSAPFHAVYKPASGEQSLWDFPDGLYQREVAAFALSEALGWGLVPPTVVRTDGPFGPGSLQLFVEADYEQHYFTLLEEGGHEDVLATMCAFDVLANNADRKSGHVLLGEGGILWGIDHGLCFHPQHKLRTVIWDFAGEEVPGDLVADLGRLASALPAELTRWLDQAEQDAVVERIDRLAATGTFPEPIGDRPPYPWPLV
jgi:uncharacterized repeat protein (TIGR03843 family)